jgi:hypothetical protein
MYFEKTNKLTLIHYLKSNEFINFKLINRTKKRLIETVSQIILSQCEQEMMNIFQEYLVANQFTEKDAEMFLKSYDFTEDKKSKQIIRNYLN